MSLPDFERTINTWFAPRFRQNVGDPTRWRKIYLRCTLDFEWEERSQKMGGNNEDSHQKLAPKIQKHKKKKHEKISFNPSIFLFKFINLPSSRISWPRSEASLASQSSVSSASVSGFQTRICGPLAPFSQIEVSAAADWSGALTMENPIF